MKSFEEEIWVCPNGHTNETGTPHCERCGWSDEDEVEEETPSFAEVFDMDQEAVDEWLDNWDGESPD